MKIFITILITVFFSSSVFCQQQQPAPSDQAEIVFNGAYIVMHKKADVVIQNTSATALTVKNGGGIISEDANNNVIWSIANDSGYSIPFVATDLTAIPVSFNTSNASGAGSITFSTYSGVPDWKNSDYLPSGINNVNRNGKDDSKRVIDRFWKISPADYIAKPHLKNLLFSYRDVEWNEDSNSITEKNLIAQNWNGTKWLSPVGSDKSSLNYVKISSVNNDFAWWTLADSNFILQDGADFSMQNIIVDKHNDQQTINNRVALSQNFPNPFSNTTTINYSLPAKFSSAKIIITDKNGNTLKQINLSQNKGFVTVDAAILVSGAYQYSLIIDNKIIGTKQMIFGK